GDIGLRLENNKIVTTVVGDGVDPFGDAEERVFEAVLDDFESGADADIFSPPPTGLTGTENFVTNLPGFDTSAGLFSTGSTVGIDITTPTLLSESLMRFDGSGLVSTAVDLQASFDTSFTRTDGTNSGSAILSLPVFSSGLGEQDAGRWHRHYVWALYEGLDGNSGDLLAPSNGVYVLELDVVTDESGIDASDPLFIVFGVGVPESQTDAALEYVENNVVPEPTSALALLAGAGLIAVRRRRRA
ncbi:MAG: PEP-CTERM sorting domain-containing protein, partial [Planctomycetota bacterium]